MITVRNMVSMWADQQIAILMAFCWWANSSSLLYGLLCQNLSLWFPTKGGSNKPAQLQRPARKLKFRSQQV